MLPPLHLFEIEYTSNRNNFIFSYERMNKSNIPKKKEWKIFEISVTRNKTSNVMKIEFEWQEN